MAFSERTYSVLVASSAPRITDALKRALAEVSAGASVSVTAVSSASAAREAFSETTFDILIIASPLPDEFGVRFAREIRARHLCEILVVCPADRYEGTFARLMEEDILVVSRPMSEPVLTFALRTLFTMRERIRAMQSRAASLEEKMAEIRTVNHAKWLLIDRLKMAEDDAQHYIEKQAMNLRISKGQLAEDIIRQYE